MLDLEGYLHIGRVEGLVSCACLFESCLTQSHVHVSRNVVRSTLFFLDI